MRTVEVTVDGTVYSMPVNFAASMQLTEIKKVGDPLKLAIALAKGEMLTVVQVGLIIAAGVRCAGCQLEQEQICDAIIEAGAQDYLQPAATYVVALVSGSPKVPVNGIKKKPKADLAESTGLQ